MLIHASIPPLKAWIGREYLFDMDEGQRGAFERCTVFGVSSYVRNALTFQVLLDAGSLFSYVPIDALRIAKATLAVSLTMGDLLYRDCPGERIAVSAYDFLRAARVDCYFKRRDLWLAGEYVCSIDWPDDNEQVHLVTLENGQLAALPNHKIKFHGGPRTFAPYRKLHQTWTVTTP